MSRKNVTNGSDATPLGDWNDHEHVSASAQVQAQKLVDAAGTPELAKQAIDAVPHPQSSPQTKDEVAKQLGFVSYLDMFEASTPVASSDEKSWAVTPAKHGKWLAWNEQDLPSFQEFDSRPEAVQYVKHRDEATDLSSGHAT